MYRYFTHKNTRRYVDALDDMLHSYNNTRHSSIGMTPTEVDGCGERRPGTKTSVSVETEIVRVEVRDGRQGANNDAETSVQKRLLGQLVSRNIRDKVSATHRSVTYQLVDLVGEPIKGKFYEQELQNCRRSQSPTTNTSI